MSRTGDVEADSTAADRSGRTTIGWRKSVGRSVHLGVCKGMQGPPTTAQPLTALTEDRLWRPERAAWYLDVKTSWVYEAVRTGRLPCHRVGRHIHFTRTMLDEWIAEQPRQ
jgi:excisionase family DNA binding protein